MIWSQNAKRSSHHRPSASAVGGGGSTETGGCVALAGIDTERFLRGLSPRPTDGLSHAGVRGNPILRHITFNCGGWSEEPSDVTQGLEKCSFRRPECSFQFLDMQPGLRRRCFGSGWCCGCSPALENAQMCECFRALMLYRNKEKKSWSAQAANLCQNPNTGWGTQMRALRNLFHQDYFLRSRFTRNDARAANHSGCGRPSDASQQGHRAVMNAQIQGQTLI